MKIFNILFSIMMLSFSLTSCAGNMAFGSISKSRDLRPGMQISEVEKIMGKPIQTQFISSKWVWKYKLHEYYKGYVPYYLVFNKDSKQLEEWYADEAEYQRNQQLWLQAFPPSQKHQVIIK